MPGHPPVSVKSLLLHVLAVVAGAGVVAGADVICARPAAARAHAYEAAAGRSVVWRSAVQGGGATQSGGNSAFRPGLALSATKHSTDASRLDAATTPEATGVLLFRIPPCPCKPISARFIMTRSRPILFTVDRDGRGVVGAELGKHV